MTTELQQRIATKCAALEVEAQSYGIAEPKIMLALTDVRALLDQLDAAQKDVARVRSARDSIAADALRLREHEAESEFEERMAYNRAAHAAENALAILDEALASSQPGEG